MKSHIDAHMHAHTSTSYSPRHTSTSYSPKLTFTLARVDHFTQQLALVNYSDILEYSRPITRKLI